MVISSTAMDTDRYTLTGNFDLLITGGCTMSCKGCTYVDYPGMGNTICKTMQPEEILEIMNKLANENLLLSSLTLLGGEPTIHPQFLEITKLLAPFKGKVFDWFQVFTNGTNLTPLVLEGLKNVDSVKFSVYPGNKSLIQKLKTSKTLQQIKETCVVNFFERDWFYAYGQEDPDYEYSQSLN